MSEETSFFSQIKNQVIAGVGVAVTAVGGIVVSQVEGLLGVEDDIPTEQVQPATQSQEVNVTGPAITINIPEQKKDTVIKKVYVKPKPKKTATEKRKEEIDW